MFFFSLLLLPQFASLSNTAKKHTLTHPTPLFQIYFEAATTLCVAVGMSSNTTAIDLDENCNIQPESDVVCDIPASCMDILPLILIFNKKIYV